MVRGNGGGKGVYEMIEEKLWCQWHFCLYKNFRRSNSSLPVELKRLLGQAMAKESRDKLLIW